jgi:hypothetical protein
MVGLRGIKGTVNEDFFMFMSHRFMNRLYCVNYGRDLRDCEWWLGVLGKWEWVGLEWRRGLWFQRY